MACPRYRRTVQAAGRDPCARHRRHRRTPELADGTRPARTHPRPCDGRGGGVAAVQPGDVEARPPGRTQPRQARTRMGNRRTPARPQGRSSERGCCTRRGRTNGRARSPPCWRQKRVGGPNSPTPDTTPNSLTKAAQRPTVGLDDLSIQEVASRALDRCAAGSSAWTPHQVREHVTRITTEYGVSASPVEVREFVHLATELAVSDCFSILPEHAARPDHVAHLTSVRVVQAEARLRDLLTAATPEQVSAASRGCGAVVCAGTGC